MSLNELFLKKRNSYLLDKLNEFVKESNSLEEDLHLENKTFSYEEQTEFLKSQIKEINQTNQLDISEMIERKEFVDELFKRNLIEKEYLENSSLEMFNIIETKKMNLEAQFKNVYKKISYLSGIKKNVKMIIEESFFNYYQINKFTENILNVDTISNCATLPIVEEEELRVDEIFLTKESNCILGNKETGRSKLLSNLLLKNPDEFVEAFKYDEGPLKCELVFKFNTSEVCNKVEIASISLNGVDDLKIEDIIYTLETNKKISIKKLLDENEVSFDMEMYKEDEKKIIYHLPVKAKQAKIIFNSSEYSIENNRKLFKIGLKEVSFKRNEYSQEGNLESEEITIGDNIYSISKEVSMFPNSSKAIDSKTFISTDGGGTYEENNAILDGFNRDLKYRHELKVDRVKIKEDGGIKNKEWFLNTSFNLSNYSKNISPVKISIKNNFSDIKVYRPEIIKRSENFEDSVILGNLKNKGTTSFFLPRALFKNKIKREEIEVYMNESLWSFKENRDELEEGFYYIDPSCYKIYFNLNEVKIFNCKIKLKPKVLFGVKKQEGYYFYIRENFDLDKKTIRLKSFNKNKSLKERILPKEESIHYLDEYILKESFVLEVKENGNWISSEDFELNETLGIIKTNGSLEKRVKYYYFENEEIKNFELWENIKEYRGVFVDESEIELETIEEKLFQPNIKRNIYTAETSEVITSDSRKSFILSNEGILVGSFEISSSIFGDKEFIEVDYINGETEFLNLKKMEKDRVPNIEPDIERKIRFTLSEAAISEHGIKVYNNEEEINTEINVLDKVCTLVVPEGMLAKELYLEYYYEVELPSVSKISVNYEKGIVYLSEEAVDDNAKVKYEIGNVGAEYSIVEDIRDVELDGNTLIVFTENLPDKNRKIKICSIEETSEISFEDLEKYYSPIIYKIKLGLG